jgi:hypothetical protein
MQKNLALAALLGTTYAGKIPMIKKELTKDMFNNQI